MVSSPRRDAPAPSIAHVLECILTSSAYTRKKQPDIVRRDLLQNAISLGATHGVSSLSLQQVAEASGVTKGGLLHHFPSKQALVEAVFDFLVADFEQALDDAMAPDPEPRGRFTRAYLDLSIVDVSELDERSALWRSVLTDPHLAVRWGEWLTAKLDQFGQDELGSSLEAVRFAADGIWMGIFANITPGDHDGLRNYLRSLTYPSARETG